MPIRFPRRISSRDPTPPPTTTTTRAIRSLQPPNAVMATLSPCRMMASTGTFRSQKQPNQRPLSLPLPKTPPPLLLLKGDELHVSPQGVARSCYQLHKDAEWRIEERYDLTQCQKSFVVSSPNFTRVIDLQEVDTRKAGTGGTTWEASMAMALYFAHHSQQLIGEVIELGSGVGLGGILLHHVTAQQQQHSRITCTDGNCTVLEQCQANIHRNIDTGSSGSFLMNTRKLDWNDNKLHPKKYHTVLACDCAYRIRDVPGLVKTLKSLLLRDRSNQGKIHLFGPYNRASYHEMIEWMENDSDLTIHVEWMELKRFRLMTASNDDSEDAWKNSNHNIFGHNGLPFPSQQQQQCGIPSLEEELEHASQSTTKFLHVTASFREQGPSRGEGGQAERPRSTSLSDID